MIKLSIKKRKNLDNNSFLKPKEYMHRDFWDEKVLLPEVSEALLKVADSIIQSMEIDVKIEDIIITGSIAGFNWHSLSDIDLHIVFDFTQIDDNFELVKRMLDQSRINWNKAHDIKIKGHEVELYFQDANEPHESKGIWSLAKNLWNVEPVPQKDVDLDLRNAEKKAETLAKAIDHIEEILEEDPAGAYKYASKIKNKVSEMRSAGLSREGIYSPENLAFKMLRNSDYLEKLSNIKIDSYDKMLSLNEMYIKDYFSKKNNSEYLEFEGKYDLEELLDPNGSAPWGEIEKENISEQARTPSSTDPGVGVSIARSVKQQRKKTKKNSTASDYKMPNFDKLSGANLGKVLNNLEKEGERIYDSKEKEAFDSIKSAFERANFSTIYKFVIDQHYKIDKANPNILTNKLSYPKELNIKAKISIKKLYKHAWNCFARKIKLPELSPWCDKGYAGGCCEEKFLPKEFRGEFGSVIAAKILASIIDTLDERKYIFWIPWVGSIATAYSIGSILDNIEYVVKNVGPKYTKEITGGLDRFGFTDVRGLKSNPRLRAPDDDKQRLVAPSGGRRNK